MNVIEIDRLVKSYGNLRALDEFSLRIPQGAIFGFLGPNGAGKTTTIRILLGLLNATAGRASVFGLDARYDRTAIAARVGYLPGDVRFQQRQKGAVFLDFCNRARGGDHGAEIQRLAKRFDLDLGRRIRNYSRGMKQKLGLIQALMHKPDLMILDEPGTALDPLVLQTLYDELRHVAADGRTVLFSSHTLSEVDQLCDRVAVIRQGRLVESGDMAELRSRAPRRVIFKLENGHSMTPAPDNAFHSGDSMDGRITGTWVGRTTTLLDWLRSMRVTDLEIGPPTLDELFHRLYRDSAPPAESSYTSAGEAR
ncbi:MAG: ABC transporter ATP-binding protein [Phycisphaerales bacterium]|nr:ABC transporter ATP-binding protein [Phycisphaerales bacterium]